MLYYVVTGAAGFIGSNLVRAMNGEGITNIIAVDNLTVGDKFRNMVDLDIADYFDKHDFQRRLLAGKFDGQIKAILHQGACSKTTESDGQYMMDNNYRYSVDLLNFCQSQSIPFLYASSAAVYGGSASFNEVRSDEMPLNVYGYSKFLFDQHVRRMMDKKTAQIVGFRYFNVYGPGENMKGAMASVAYHFFNQYLSTGSVKLFMGTDGVENGEQRRDFIHVDDVVAANLWFLKQPDISGIFNLGTGEAATFNQVACNVINGIRKIDSKCPLTLEALKAAEMIQYVPFPDVLKGKYQNYTQANLTKLRETGYPNEFLSIDRGIPRYMEILGATLGGDKLLLN